MKPLLVLLTLLTACASSSHSNDSSSPSDSQTDHSLNELPLPPYQNIVLIQGVHLDDSSWNDVKAIIDPRPFNVKTLNRIGRDTETPSSLKTIATLSCEQISEKSIVVAHSYGGAIANEMVGICPDKISKIIYISAVIPLRGELPFAIMSATDQKAYGKAVDFDTKEKKIVPKNGHRFFHRTDATYEYHTDHHPKLYAEWMSLTTEPIEYDVARFNAIPKAYIFTEKDEVIAPATQKSFVKRTKIKNTSGVPSGHFPMLSQPKKLAEQILKWAE